MNESDLALIYSAATLSLVVSAVAYSYLADKTTERAGATALVEGGATGLGLYGCLAVSWELFYAPLTLCSVLFLDLARLWWCLVTFPDQASWLGHRYGDHKEHPWLFYVLPWLARTFAVAFIGLESNSGDVYLASIAVPLFLFVALFMGSACWDYKLPMYTLLLVLPYSLSAFAFGLYVDLTYGFRGLSFFGGAEVLRMVVLVGLEQVVWQGTDDDRDAAPPPSELPSEVSS